MIDLKENIFPGRKPTHLFTKFYYIINSLICFFVSKDNKNLFPQFHFVRGMQRFTGRSFFRQSIFICPLTLAIIFHENSSNSTLISACHLLIVIAVKIYRSCPSKVELKYLSSCQLIPSTLFRNFLWANKHCFSHLCSC